MLALSGGVDSSALAHILAILSNSGYPVKLHAFTLNHCLRKEAGDDLKFVLDLCAQLAIPFGYAEVDVARISSLMQMGLEETGRKIRYELLEDERKKRNADFIATGHHKNDLSEDILLRLIRGAGWPALGGMAARDDRRHIIRPLMSLKKTQLIEFMQECGLVWRTDASNESGHFRRNRIRKIILPELRKENPALDDTLHSVWEMAQKDNEYWQKILDKALQDQPWREIHSSTCASIVLPEKLLASLPSAARLRLYLACVREIARIAPWSHGLQARSATLFDLDQAYTDKKGNIKFQLPGRASIVLKRGNIEFRCEMTSSAKSKRSVN